MIIDIPLRHHPPYHYPDTDLLYATHLPSIYMPIWMTSMRSTLKRLLISSQLIAPHGSAIIPLNAVQIARTVFLSNVTSTPLSIE